VVLLLLLLLAPTLLPLVLLLCRPCQLHNTLRHWCWQHLPGGLLIHVVCLVGMSACLLPLWPPSNSRCCQCLGPGAKPVCILQYKLQLLLLAGVAADDDAAAPALA
jgi:hypothetical protein